MKRIISFVLSTFLIFTCFSGVAKIKGRGFGRNIPIGFWF